jgi:hypothetical protein
MVRAGTWAVSIGVTMVASASFAQSMYPEFDDGSTAPPEVTAAIENLVGEFAARWSSKAWPTMLELWDPDEETPYYLLSHQPDWLIGWDQMNGYFSKKPTAPVKEVPEQAPPGIQQIELSHYEYRSEKDLIAMLYTASDIRVRLIAPDLALAAWYVQFDYKPMFMPAKGEAFKANAIFRNTADGWKFIHYAEAPMSAIMYIERMYRKQASPEFSERFNKKKAGSGE